MWNKTRRVGDKVLGQLARFIAPRMVRSDKTDERRPAPEIYRVVAGHNEAEAATWIAFMRRRGYQTTVTARTVRADGFGYPVVILTARKAGSSEADA